MRAATFNCAQLRIKLNVGSKHPDSRKIFHFRGRAELSAGHLRGAGAAAPQPQRNLATSL